MEYRAKMLNSKKLFAILYCFNILNIILIPASKIKKNDIAFFKISVYKIFIHKNILVDKLSVNIINQIYIIIN